MTTSLQRRLEAIYGLERRKDKLGLDGTRALLAALGNPQDRFRSVHVAGTNGKGSTCAVIERVLREAGYRSGLYTSPHLVDFRERIRVSGRWVDEDWLERALDRIESLPEGQGRTFFEVATALGFLYFAEQEVDIAVVEVGLGGRLDCTNVITPLVSVITAIGLDHAEILGDTIEKIAFEKAGIIKPGIPVVLHYGTPEAALFLESVAAERGAPIATISSAPGPETSPETRQQWNELMAVFASESDPSMRAPCLIDNAGPIFAALLALVLQGIRIPPSAVRRATRSVRWPGRFERCPTIPRLWWDGAHNTEAIYRLAQLWRRCGPTANPARVVLAVSRDKDLPRMLARLHLFFQPLRLIVTRSRSARAADPEVMRLEASRQGIDVEVAPDVRSAVERALAESGKGEVLLTGSLFAVGEAMEAFGGAPGEYL